MKVIVVSTLSMLFLMSCSYRNSEQETSKYADRFSHDEVSLSGAYYWSFQLMGGKQLSTHTFYADSIVYSMEGKVYSTDYTMRKLSYEAATGKWIGEDADNVVYVLFFRDKTDSTVTIYKRKCDEAGLREAINFGVPAHDATDDHGWNLYALEDDGKEDVLPIVGKYTTKDKLSIDLTDRVIVYNNRAFEKLSYHSGERRWVGKGDKAYLQVFFQDLKADNDLLLDVSLYNDLEVAYRTKYAEATWENYKKQ